MINWNSLISELVKRSKILGELLASTEGNEWIEYIYFYILNHLESSIFFS